MNHEVPHDLDPDTARKVADHAWESYSERFAKYDPTIEWIAEDRAQIGFAAKGVQLTGFLQLKPRSIAMDLNVPFLLRPFRKKAIDVIEGEIRRWVGKAKSGQI